MPGGFDDIELEKIFCFSDNFVQKSNEIENEEEKYLNFTGKAKNFFKYFLYLELLITPPGFTNTVDFRNLNIPFVGKLLKGDVDLDKESLEIPEIFDNAENKQNSTSIKNVDTIIKYQVKILIFFGNNDFDKKLKQTFKFIIYKIFLKTLLNYLEFSEKQRY